MTADAPETAVRKEFPIMKRFFALLLSLCLLPALTACGGAPAGDNPGGESGGTRVVV